MVHPERPRVLVIDDDDLVRSLLAAALEDDGWRVLASDHALDPTDISQLRPAVVVLDLRLAAGDDGWLLLERLRSTPGAREIPVLVCSADDGRTRNGAERLHALGAAVVAKPFAIDALLAAVAGVAEGDRR